VLCGGFSHRSRAHSLIYLTQRARYIRTRRRTPKQHRSCILNLLGVDDLGQPSSLASQLICGLSQSWWQIDDVAVGLADGTPQGPARANNWGPNHSALRTSPFQAYAPSHVSLAVRARCDRIQQISRAAREMVNYSAVPLLDYVDVATVLISQNACGRLWGAGVAAVHHQVRHGAIQLHADNSRRSAPPPAASRRAVRGSPAPRTTH